MGDKDQRVPMAAAPPTRAALAAAVTKGASAGRTKRKACQNIVQIIHGSWTPRARDKRISLRKFKGCQI